MRTVIDGPLNVPALLARAALTARGRSGPLPDLRLARTGVTVDVTGLAAYDRVCRFPLANTLPPTYPQVLAFPLQLALMVDRAFPLALPGLVHIRNRIDVARPVVIDEVLEIEVWAMSLASHRSGTTVDLCASVSAGGGEVWRSRSTYLARGVTAPDGTPETVAAEPVGDPGRADAVWRIPANAGRRYAAVSGDVNPIHLSALTAKAFGFRRAIAHGMWVKARALGALSPRLPDAMSIDVNFVKPLYLPSTVVFAGAPRDDGWDFAVGRPSSGSTHLLGTVRTI